MINVDLLQVWVKVASQFLFFPLSFSPLFPSSSQKKCLDTVSNTLHLVEPNVKVRLFFFFVKKIFYFQLPSLIVLSRSFLVIRSQTMFRSVLIFSFFVSFIYFPTFPRAQVLSLIKATSALALSLICVA